MKTVCDFAIHEKLLCTSCKQVTVHLLAIYVDKGATAEELLMGSKYWVKLPF